MFKFLIITLLIAASSADIIGRPNTVRRRLKLQENDLIDDVSRSFSIFENDDIPDISRLSRQDAYIREEEDIDPRLLPSFARENARIHDEDEEDYPSSVPGLERENGRIHEDDEEDLTRSPPRLRRGSLRSSGRWESSV
jgi:hypothetical protein